MFSKHNNQAGFLHLQIVALIVVVVAALGFTGWYVWHANHATPKATNGSSFKTNPKSETSSTAALATNSVQPAKPITSTQTTTPKSNTTTPTSNPTQQNTSPPSQSPQNQYSLSVTTNGCYINAAAYVSGLSVVAGAMQNGHGADHTYSLTPSNGVSEPTGGQLGWTAYGEIVDSSGNILDKVTGQVTSSSCPAPSG